MKKKQRKIFTLKKVATFGLLAAFIFVLLVLLPKTGSSVPNIEATTDLVNGDFENGVQGWAKNPQQIEMPAATVDGRKAACIVMPADGPVGFPYLYQHVKVQPGEAITLTLSIMGLDLSDGHGAYCALEFYDAAGKRIQAANANSDPHTKEKDGWREYKLRSIAPDQANATRICLVLNGHGTAYFDDVSLQRPNAKSTMNGKQPEQATLQLTDKIVCQSFHGFGVEDDGQLHSEVNRSFGVNQKDYQFFEERIRWLNPHTVRMFSWYKDWCPSEDWTNFTYESPGMQSHYRALDLYQSLGTRVNLTGSELQMNTDLLEAPTDKVAASIGQFFEYLIRVKRYTCIKDFTLLNEPDRVYQKKRELFPHYSKLHQQIDREFSARRLDINIIGSDEASSLPWFQECVKDTAYYETMDYFASHMYLPEKDRSLGKSFFTDRLTLLAARKSPKPLLVTEFGFRDQRSDVINNPVMKTYPYSLWIMDYCLTGLNEGVAGFSQFCAGSVYYPGPGLMDYALWDFKDNDWAVRPVYHAWAAFCRMSNAGDEVRECISSEPQFVKGAFVGRTLFWVNLSDKSVAIHLQGIRAGKLRIMTEDSLSGDRECGRVENIEADQFSAPPLSFGYTFE